MTAAEIRDSVHHNTVYGDGANLEAQQTLMLAEIAAQLAELNHFLRNDVLNVETGLDKGGPLEVKIVGSAA